MDILTRTHTNKGIRETNEQTPKTLSKTDRLRSKCVKLYDKERREDRLQCGLKQCGEWPETERNLCLACEVLERGLFASASRCNIDVHLSRRRRLFGAVRCFFTCRRTTKLEWQGKNNDFDTYHLTQTSLRATWSPNAVRHHLALRLQHLEYSPPSPRAAILSMAKSSSVKRTSLNVRMLENTWDLKHMWLWCIDYCHELVICVGVQCGKTCFVTKCIAVALFIKRCPKLKKKK